MVINKKPLRLRQSMLGLVNNGGYSGDSGFNAADNVNSDSDFLSQHGNKQALDY